MNLTELIEELELDAQMANEMENAHPEDGRLQMEAAGMLRKMVAALQPFAEAAVKADKDSDAQERLIGSRMGSLASPGWGIRRFHLDAAREILGGNVKEHATLSARAHVDHGVKVQTREDHENRAADRGCCVSACSPFLCLAY